MRVVPFPLAACLLQCAEWDCPLTGHIPACKEPCLQEVLPAESCLGLVDCCRRRDLFLGEWGGAPELVSLPRRSTVVCRAARVLCP